MSSDRLQAALALRIPPLALVFLIGLLMWFASSTLPALRFRTPARHVLVAALAGAGVVLCYLGIAAFQRARTTVDPRRPQASAALVRTGIYARTRNPMYVGFVLVLAAWAVYLSNVVAFVFLPAFVAYMNHLQIAPEEKALAERFGREFADYKERVPRWL